MKCELIKADVPTVNGHIYSRAVIEKMIEDIGDKEILGSFDINTDLKIRMDQISHKVENFRVDEGGNLYGDVVVLGTPKGKELYKLIVAGLNDGRLTLHPLMIGNVDDNIVKEVKLSNINICLTDEALI